MASARALWRTPKYSASPARPAEVLRDEAAGRAQ